jgi:hypothetical protein
LLVSLRACAVDKVGGGVIGPAWRLGCASACVALTLWTQTDAGDGDGRVIWFVVGPIAGAINQVCKARVIELVTLMRVVSVTSINLTKFLCAGLVSAGHIFGAAVPSGAAGVETRVFRCGWVGWCLVLLLAVFCIVNATLLPRCRHCWERSGRWLLRIREVKESLLHRVDERVSLLLLLLLLIIRCRSWCVATSAIASRLLMLLCLLLLPAVILLCSSVILLHPPLLLCSPMSVL